VNPAESTGTRRTSEEHPGPAPTGLRALLSRYSIQRWRHGELGALPVVLGLLVIAAYFESQEPAFLSARNLSNLIVQIAATGSVAVGIVLVLLLGEIDLSVGSVTGLCSALLGVLIVKMDRHGGWPFSSPSRPA